MNLWRNWVIAAVKPVKYKILDNITNWGMIYSWLKEISICVPVVMCEWALTSSKSACVFVIHQSPSQTYLFLWVRDQQPPGHFTPLPVPVCHISLKLSGTVSAFQVLPFLPFLFCVVWMYKQCLICKPEGREMCCFSWGGKTKSQQCL